MKGKKHSSEQIIEMLRQAEAELNGGASIGQVCQKLAISEQTFHRWRNQFGGKNAGHPSESYRTSWGEEAKGLTKTKDGRWRISATRERVTEESEVRAVRHFNDVMASRAPVPVQISKQLPAPDFAGWAEKYCKQGDEENSAEMSAGGWTRYIKNVLNHTILQAVYDRLG